LTFLRVNSHSRQKCVKFLRCFYYVIMHLDQLQGVQYYVHCKNTPKLLHVTIAIHR
jgi:hypothetical protein